VPVKRSNSRVRCILSFPGSTETRWLDKPPSPGLRLRDDGGHGYAAQVWIVDEVLQSGPSTYTVICVGQTEYMETLRNRSGFKPDLGAELLEVVRRTRTAVAERRRKRKYRNYSP
jgi:hypothetical protein